MCFIFMRINWRMISFYAKFVGFFIVEFYVENFLMEIFLLGKSLFYNWGNSCTFNLISMIRNDFSHFFKIYLRNFLLNLEKLIYK